MKKAFSVLLCSLMALTLLCACSGMKKVGGIPKAAVKREIAFVKPGQNARRSVWSDGEKGTLQQFTKEFPNMGYGLLRLLRTGQEETKRVSLEEAISDTEALLAMLQAAYGGYDYFGGDQAFDECRDKIITRLETASLGLKQTKTEKIPGDISAKTLAGVLSDELAKIVLDLHFQIGTQQINEDNRNYMYYVPDIYFDPDQLEAQLRGYAKPTITPEGEIKHWFAALGQDAKNLPTSAAVDGVLHSLSWTRAEPARQTEQIAFRETVKSGVHVLKSNTMTATSTTLGALEAFAQSGAEYGALRDQTIVFDLRGNSGGNSWYSHMYVAERLFGHGARRKVVLRAEMLGPMA